MDNVRVFAASERNRASRTPEETQIQGDRTADCLGSRCIQQLVDRSCVLEGIGAGGHSFQPPWPHLVSMTSLRIPLPQQITLSDNIVLPSLVRGQPTSGESTGSSRIARISSRYAGISSLDPSRSLWASPPKERRSSVSQAPTSGGSFSSFFLSILNSATNNFRAVAKIATLCGLFRLFRIRQ